MNPIAPYELMDFGWGRKLERFGDVVVVRPAPGIARIEPRHRDAWAQATLIYHRHRDREEEGQWEQRAPPPDRWHVGFEAFRLQLRPAAAGQVGLFPEQAENWAWIAAQVQSAGRPIRVLNLFAYTGASTLAAAAAGADVTHVDAARGFCAWARQNAVLSGLGAAPVRWITDDARTFVRRELKRGRDYQGVILDPPTYGHGPRGEVWKLEKHLPPLLQAIGELTAAARAFILLSCHTTDWEPAALRQLLVEAIPKLRPQRVEVHTLALRTATGESLPAGAVARAPAKPPSTN